MSNPRRLERFGAPTLAYDLFEPKGEARGSVFLVHGYADHMGRFQEVVDAWTQRGLCVGTLDLRGHGRSDGRRGYLESFDDYCRDADDVLRRLDAEEPWRRVGRPPVLFGHSLGGLVAAHLALRAPGRFSGLAMSSPFLATADPVPKLKTLAARVAKRVYPRYTEPSFLKGADLTHDTERAVAYDADLYHFNHVFAGWYVAVLDAQAALMKQASRLTLPVFIMAAGDDRVVDVGMTKRFFGLVKSEDKDLVVLEGRFHEILNEVDRSEYIAKFCDQMLRWLS